MKAMIAESQEGFDKFCENESWRMIYESAPDGAKDARLASLIKKQIEELKSQW